MIYGLLLIIVENLGCAMKAIEPQRENPPRPPLIKEGSF
jgi:hypothetical protein